MINKYSKLNNTNNSIFIKIYYKITKNLFINNFSNFYKILK